MDSKPLIEKNGRRPGSQLTAYDYYDPYLIFHMRHDVVKGFLVLLAAPEADEQMAYHTILDGNVLNHCLGDDKIAITRTKAFLAGLDVDTHQPRIVSVYSHLFSTLSQYHKSLTSTWCGPFCCICQIIAQTRYKRLALESIEDAFVKFEQEVSH